MGEPAAQIVFGWNEWGGGKCPLPEDMLVEVQLQGGSPSSLIQRAGNLSWTHVGSAGDIVRYRLTVGEVVAELDAAPDMINAPPHYARPGKIECIDAIRDALTQEEFRGFCKGTAMRYLWRERDKGGNESLEKIVPYVKWAVDA